jgi:dipeptidyl aminopeptidase/acylaminoacyl peptidase
MSLQSLKGFLTRSAYGANPVKTHLALLGLGLVAALMLAGQLARAQPPRPAVADDASPYWSSDARTVAFDRASPLPDGGHVLFTPAGRGNERDVLGTGRIRGFRPAGGEVLVEEPGVDTTVRDAADHQLASVSGTAATWSPDGGRIAYLRDGSLYVADATGANETLVHEGIARPSWDLTGPIWSPDGRRIVVATAGGLLAVDADGSTSQILFAGDNQIVNPSWSPDGYQIAFERNSGGHWSIWLVTADGTDPLQVFGGADVDYRFPQWSPVGKRLAFISDRQHVPGEASPWQYALYVQDVGGGKAQKLVDDVRPDSPARWSPTAAQLAVAAGQECLRFGVYVVASEAPAGAHRRSNLCRFEGTPGTDFLTGTPFHDVINGLGGDDRLIASGGDDRIEGNNGQDSVSAGAGNDFVFGGPGDDILSGGPGNDTIIGGPGVDHIGCGPGNDTAYVGPKDTVRDCEHVHRT